MNNQNDSALRLPEKAFVAKTPLLEVADLHAWYGAAHILHGVSLSVGQIGRASCRERVYVLV